MDNTGELGLWMFLILIGGFAFIGLLISVAEWIEDFQHELKYLNMEIRRTEGEEQQHYKREKRRLLLSVLPFFRR